MSVFYWLLALQLFIFSAHAASETSSEDSTPAYWDYGIGFGAARFEHYPAANQYTTLALPAPTFQYRGRILRADDRDGAHLYLLKNNSFTIEFSGTGSAALKSSDNKAREGMADLPWVVALGPQAVYRPNSDWTLAFGIFQATSTDFVMTRYQGYVFEGKISREWEDQINSWQRKLKLSLELQAATKEYHALYFDVDHKDSRADRSVYFSQAGFLSHQIGLSQSLKSGRFSLFGGVFVSSYAWSVNRESPMHKADFNGTLAIGFNYVLGESKKPEIPESETSGVINRLRHKDTLRNFE